MSRPWRSPERLAVVAAAVAATCLLTTFSVPTAGAGDLAAAAAPGADRPAFDDAPQEATAPQLGRLLTTEHDDGYPLPELPELPEIEVDERELTPFRSATAPGVSEHEVVPADLVVHAPEGGDLDLDDLAEPLASALHVAAAAALTADASPGSGRDEPQEVSVLGVDGPTFRPLTPDVTAAADAVWERLADGDALVSHEVAEQLGVELGGTIVLRNDAASVPVRVGAFAANGSPSLADVVVPLDVAALLGEPSPNLLIVTATDDVSALGHALEAATGGVVDVLRPPAPPVSERRDSQQRQARGTASGQIEGFAYTTHRDGRITIHGDWVARNIVTVQIPRMGSTRCHRVMVPQLAAAIEELLARDLYGHLDPAQFAGCFVARHIDWNPSKRLSMHAWGLAIDFNVRDNPLGARPTMDPRVVEVFERWGFEWGGHWRRPDGMHFELARIVPVP